MPDDPADFDDTLVAPEGPHGPAGDDDPNVINVNDLGMKPGGKVEPPPNEPAHESVDDTLEKEINTASINPHAVAKLMAEPTFETAFADIDEKTLIVIPNSVLAAIEEGESTDEMPPEIALMVATANEILEEEGGRYSRIPELSEAERFDLVVGFGESLDDDKQFKTVQKVVEEDDWQTAWDTLLNDDETLAKPWEAYVHDQLHEEAVLWLETLGISLTEACSP